MIWTKKVLILKRHCNTQPLNLSISIYMKIGRNLLEMSTRDSTLLHCMSRSARLGLFLWILTPETQSDFEKKISQNYTTGTKWETISLDPLDQFCSTPNLDFHLFIQVENGEIPSRLVSMSILKFS